MPYEDYKNLTDADYEDLPPLVPAGADRKAILAEVVERWATQTQDLIDEDGRLTADFATQERHPATLKRIDLRDDNSDAEPIDLGRDLLRPLTEHLAAADISVTEVPPTTSEIEPTTELDWSPAAAVCLFGCLVHETSAEELSLSAHLIAAGCRFDAITYFRHAKFRGNTDFRGATFGGKTSFNDTTFGGGAVFHKTTFNEILDFGSAKLRRNLDFSDAMFTGDANFGQAMFSGDAYFRNTRFCGPTRFVEATFSGYLGFSSTKFSDRANFHQAVFNDKTVFRNTFFSRTVHFINATFNGKLEFSDVEFGSESVFRHALFNSDAHFTNTMYSDNAYFRDTTFSKNVAFCNARFGRNAEFHSATFNGKSDFSNVKFGDPTDFSETVFGDELNFYCGRFGSDALFINATFNGYANFHSAVFDDRADFHRALFNATAKFDRVTLSGSSDFSEAKFNNNAQFIKTTFIHNAQFRNADFRRGKVLVNDRPLRRELTGKKRRLGITDRVNWRAVRSTGELTALTRVSYFALIGVPLLAGVWGPARTWIVRQNDALKRATDELRPLVEKLPQDLSAAEELRRWVDGLAEATLPETMPVGWLLAFLAAFAVVLAQLIYQTRAPELIRQESEDDLIEAANEINRQDGISDERLRKAIDFLHTAADLMPHRHSAWFVARERRTVWIPDNVDEHFEDAEVDETKPADAGDDWEPTKKVKATDQEVDAADRKRIAIEEGQRARYAVAAFEARSAAWLSGGLYLLAGWLSLMIVLRQLGHIAAASPATWLAWPARFFTQGWLIVTVAVLILLMTVAGSVLVRDGWAAKQFDRAAEWGAWRKGTKNAKAEDGSADTASATV
ncbi:MAG: pentapeptide repeat-containing protein [Planctomycetota bacterium]